MILNKLNPDVFYKPFPGEIDFASSRRKANRERVALLGIHFASEPEGQLASGSNLGKGSDAAEVKVARFKALMGSAREIINSKPPTPPPDLASGTEEYAEYAYFPQVLFEMDPDLGSLSQKQRLDFIRVLTEAQKICEELPSERRENTKSLEKALEQLRGLLSTACCLSRTWHICRKIQHTTF